MRKVLVKMGGALLAALLLLLPMSAFAAPDTANAAIPEEEITPTGEMLRSERYLRSILSEQNAARQATLFSEFINIRLKYATARSLCRTDGGKWMGCVDIVETFEDGKLAGYLLQLGTVQYGYQKLPTGTASCDLTIGSVSKTLEYSGQTLFSFPVFELERDALEGDIALNVTYYNAQYDIPLVQNYPGVALEKDEALKAMAPAYVTYLSGQETIETEMIDHAVMKLKSYVRNSRTQERSYIWELYLIHGDELPAPATVIRYDTYQDTTRVSRRTLREYF